MREPLLYIATGIPCSGKTNLISRVFHEERIFSVETRGTNRSPHISRTWRDVWHKFGTAQVNWAGTKIGVRFAWDGCFPTPRHRSQMIGTTRAHGWKVIGLFFDTPLDICLERNAQRPESERVFRVKIERMYDTLVIPRPHEGYDDIIVVSPGREREVIERIRGKQPPITYATM
jgi:predicted kinase